MYSKINNKGQVGETVTWVVATVVIIVVLGISIFIASFFFSKEKAPDIFSITTADTLASKSLFSYALTKDDTGKTVYSELKAEDNLNEFNGEIAKKIFKDFYEKDYADVWLGLVIKRAVFQSTPNDYLGRKPTGVRGGDLNFQRRFVSRISDNLTLNENKSVEFYLAKEASTR